MSEPASYQRLGLVVNVDKLQGVDAWRGWLPRFRQADNDQTTPYRSEDECYPSSSWALPSFGNDKVIEGPNDQAEKAGNDGNGCQVAHS